MVQVTELGYIGIGVTTFTEICGFGPHDSSSVRIEDEIVRSSSQVAAGKQVDVELGTGSFGARVEETR